MKLRRPNLTTTDFILEILIIVIGISIAFWVDNWKEQRAMQKQEVEILNGLLSDLEQTDEEILRRSGEDSVDIRSITKFINLVDTLTATKINVNSEEYFSWIYTISFDPVTVTFESIKASGKIELISNKKIRYEFFELQRYYAKDIIAFNNWYPEWLSKWTDPILFEYIDLKQLYSEDENIELDREMLQQINLNTLYAIKNSLEGKLWAYNLTYDKNQEVKELIRAELERFRNN